MTDCILWPGKVDKDGYGRTTRGPRGANKVWRAHRLAYAEAHGLSFEDMQSVPPLMHSCDTPACINPAHLSPGTQADNIADMVSKGRACRGSDVCGSKLQERDVLGIRRQYVKGCRTYGARALARVYGVTKRTIEQVASGATWAHFERFLEDK